MTSSVEEITAGGKTLAYIIRAGSAPAATSFVTRPEANFQAGFVVYPAGSEIARHVHLLLKRRINTTSEVVMVRKGLCEVSVYNDERETIASRRLHEGDIVIFLAGGHGFRLIEDTVLFEVKQGPYTGLEEKERF